VSLSEEMQKSVARFRIAGESTGLVPR